MTPSSDVLSRDAVRLGVVGLGAVAQAVHLPLIARLGDAMRLAALCDLSPTLLRVMGERYGVSPEARTTDLATMLDMEGIDGVVILTSGSHGGAAQAALDRGIPVLCEKPLAHTLAEADRLAASPAADRLLLGYMKVFDPAVEEARRRFLDPASGLGDLRQIEVTVLHPTNESQLAFAHLAPAPADIDPEVMERLHAESARLLAVALGTDAGSEFGRLYGGILVGSLVHELAVIRAVTGDPGPLEIDHVDLFPEGAWPPSVTIAARRSDGVRVAIGWHFLDHYPAYREDVRFHHRGGSIELTFPAPYRLHLPTKLVVSTGGDERRSQFRFEAIDEAFEVQLMAFRDLVRDGVAPRTGIADGRTDLVTCQRIVARLAADRGVAVGGEAGRA